jgi:hypothetical protein
MKSTYNANEADDHYRKKKRQCGRNYAINPWHLMKPFTNISTETKKREATCMSILGERENIDIIGPTPINAGDKFRTGGVLVKGLIL